MTAGAPRRLAACLQMPHGEALDENLAKAAEMADRARSLGAAIAVLPEYWFSTRDPRASHDPQVLRDALARMSRGMTLAANVLDRREGRLLNVGVCYHDGRLLFEQPKVHPMPREAAQGIGGWPRLDAHGELGLLVCADILYPEAARVLELLGARILLNPVLSAWREGDEGKAAREAMYVARAYDSRAFVLKAGGYRAGLIAGRSLIAAPWGLLARYHDDFAQEIVTAELDMAKLDAFRKDKERFPPRSPAAYRPLVE